MNKIIAIAFAVVFAISTSACTTTGGTKQTGGAILGGVGGAVAGSQFGKGKGQLVGVAVGTLLGAFIGSEVGASLDRADVAYANQTAQNTFERAPSGRQGQWSNPDSGNYGYVTPTRTFQAQNGQYCREYTQQIYVGGRVQEGHGIACRQQDGTWEIVK